ncbi:translation initiation factor IF-2 [candidate division KSB1 bacterium]|nr:translation initiation factor IF-2 [candidate division KSB1 bacterium]
MRIYKVAKDFSVSNEALIDFLTEKKFKVRNHMSPLSEEMHEAVCQHFHISEAEIDKEPDFRKKIQEKHKEEEARKEAIRHEIDEMLELSKAPLPEIAPASEVQEKPEPVSKIAEKQDKKEKPIEVAVKQENLSDSVNEDDIKSAKQGEDESKKIEAIKPHKIKDIKKTDAKSEDDSSEKPKRHLKRLPKVDEAGVVEDRPGGRKRGKPQPQSTQTSESSETAAGLKKKRRKKKRKKTAVKIDEKEIEASIKETLAKMSDSPKRRKHRKERDVDDVEVDETNIVHTTEFCSVAELANLMDVESSEVIQACIGLGLMVSINQRLEKDTILMVADEFDYEVNFLSEYGEDHVEEVFEEVDDPELLEPRPPVVTIMGHVDHGKTSLLDHLRESNIIAGEAGGITQHIGAYEVQFKDKMITFLDTPGHEAFTAMRARGAQATDIVVLVVAADDSVMPQTIEAINHAKAAGVPLVVAINKMDKPNANSENIKKQLSNKDVLVEDWGGKVQAAEVSAKTGEGIEKLLDLILLESEILELKANPHAAARGVLIETKMDKGKGIVGTVLVQRGTLHTGDIFVAGQFSGRVRAMMDERFHKINEAPPSTPVQVLGFGGAPQAGDHIVVVSSEQEAREISVKRQQLKREQGFRQVRRLTLDQISKQIAEGEVKELSIILKADVDGSVEVLADSLMKLTNEDVAIRIIHKGVGAITESDVILAAASQAVIVGFHIVPTSKAKEEAAREEVDIRLYKVIYDVVNDIKLALSGLLEPEISEEILGEVEIRGVFKASKVGKIAGCYVQTGKVTRNGMARLIRDGIPIYEGKISTLKRFKDDAKEVAAGFECGLTLDKYSDIKEGDIVEVYHLIETERTLE